jgi:hypothetical protein
MGFRGQFAMGRSNVMAAALACLPGMRVNSGAAPDLSQLAAFQQAYPGGMAQLQGPLPSGMLGVPYRSSDNWGCGPCGWLASGQAQAFPCGLDGPQYGRRRGWRKTKLGFSQLVGGLSSVTFSINCTDIFMGTALQIPAASSNPGVFIDSIKVGSIEQLPLGSVPALIFSEVSTDNEIDMDVAQVSQNVIVTVRNTNVGQVNFEGAFLGYTNRC